MSEINSVNVGTSLPETVRNLIRNGQLKSQPTSGYCGGFKQANVAIVHKSIAEDLKSFCAYNTGALPLLAVSDVGQLDSELAPKSNIKTDVPSYCVYKDGIESHSVEALEDFNLEDFVTFYIGCSFSFEEALLVNKIPIRNIEQKKNVSMFKTNIRCHAIGIFDCFMVVSYRPIPRKLLSLVTSITSTMPDVHGAPIHIGDPSVIGISGILSPDYGDSLTAMPDDVPVFWCCGITLRTAIMSAKSPLAFTHQPGSMFLTDVSMPSAVECNEICCEVIEVSPKKYSVISTDAADKLRSIMDEISKISGRTSSTDKFLKHSLLLSHMSSVVMTIGQGIQSSDVIVLMLLKETLQAFGKDVTMIADEDVHETCVEMHSKVYSKDESSHPKHQVHNAGTLDEKSFSKFDVVMKMNAAGLKIQGANNKMSNSMKRLLHNATCANIDVIDVDCWDVHGLSAAVQVLATCEHHDRYLRRAVGKPRDHKKKFDIHVVKLKQLAVNVQKSDNFPSASETFEDHVAFIERLTDIV